MPNESRRMTEMVLRIGGRNKTVRGVTEKTTCADVIKIVLCKFKKTYEDTHSYALFECGNNSMRMLPDKTRVLKAMRLWGTGNTRYLSLKAVRKEDKANKTNTSEFSPKRDELNNLDATTISDSSKANDIMVNLNAFVGAKEVKRVDKINNIKYATEKVLKHKIVSETNGHINSNAKTDTTYTLVTSEYGRNPNVPKRQSTPNRYAVEETLKRHKASLAEDITSHIAQMGQKERKDVILQKYFADYLTYNSPRREPFPVPKRERGDGAENISSRGNPDKGDGVVSTDTPLSSSTARARRHSDSDSGQEDHNHDDNLDNAFVSKPSTGHFHTDYRYATIKPLPRKLVSYDVTMATRMDRLVDYSYSDSDTQENTVDILERNVLDEDDEMASFMDSKLHDDFSDEGLSSWGSDNED